MTSEEPSLFQRITSGPILQIPAAWKAQQRIEPRMVEVSGPPFRRWAGTGMRRRWRPGRVAAWALSSPPERSFSPMYVRVFEPQSRMFLPNPMWAQHAVYMIVGQRLGPIRVLVPTGYAEAWPLSTVDLLERELIRMGLTFMVESFLR